MRRVVSSRSERGAPFCLSLKSDAVFAREPPFPAAVFFQPEQLRKYYDWKFKSLCCVYAHEFTASAVPPAAGGSPMRAADPLILL